MSNCKLIALTNQKSGVGKITTAVNLGVSLTGKTFVDLTKKYGRDAVEKLRITEKNCGRALSKKICRIL